MSHNFFKIGAAAALTITGISTATSVKTVSASSFKTAVKRVRIKYLPGQGLKIWTNYNNGQFRGFRAKDGTEWNIAQTAIDKSGNLWYKVGTREWIEARYTEDIDPGQEQAEKAKKAKKPKKTKSPVLQILDKTAKNVASKKEKAAKKTGEKTATVKKDDQAVKAPVQKPSAVKTTVKKVKKIKKAKQIVANTVNKIKSTSTPKQAPASTQAPAVSNSTKVNAVVNLAKQQLGKPYIWGGGGPDNFDCSGLVQYVYSKAAGVMMPRTTTDQVKVGTTVGMDQLQAGDLLYWGDPSAPYHVAIYVGNNQYVNAATPEQGTILQTITSYYYPTVAKRVL